MTEIAVSDDEIEALMAELEAEGESIIAASKAETPTPTPAPAPVKAEPVAVEVKPEPVAPVVKEAEVVVEKVVASTTPAPAPMPVAAAPKVVETKTPDVPVEAPKTLEKTVVAPIEEAVKVAEFESPKTDVTPGLQHYIDVDQFRSDTRVTDANLDACMLEQSGLRAYYGSQAARAEAQEDRLKARFEVIEATIYDHHRKALAAAGEKTTEKMVDAAVKMDPRWLKTKNLVIEAGTIAAINKGLVESLKDRRDMIIQLGADRRDEYKGAARVMQEQADRDDLRVRAAASAARG